MTGDLNNNIIVPTCMVLTYLPIHVCQEEDARTNKLLEINNKHTISAFLLNKTVEILYPKTPRNFQGNVKRFFPKSPFKKLNLAKKYSVLTR